MQTTTQIIRLKTLAQLLDVSPVTIFRWRKKKIIPAPIILGERIIGWEKSTIDEWLAGLNKTPSKNSNK